MLETKYNHKSVEEGKYESWMSKGYFESGDLSKKPYCIVIPPPNVTGKLHLGHAWDTTLQDIIIRYKRMDGYDTLWLPGMDHAAIATEAKVVQRLKNNGINKYELGREKFLDACWDWTHEYSGNIRAQWAKLGLSLDYRKEAFTLDENLTKAVKHVFVTLYNEGLIYRGERIINWDPVAKTALSNEEVIYKEDEGAFYHLKYFIEDSDEYLDVATTRPETMFGDTAVAVNPEDERYKHLIGKNVILPVVNKLIPIVGDEHADPEFGTGVVKITPAHDPNDFEVGNRHNLERVVVMNEDATMNENAGKYVGLTREECREALVKDLTDSGILISIEKMVHSVGHSERTDAVVEPYLSKQWFVKMRPLADRVLENQKNKDSKVNFVPPRYEKTMNHWMEITYDWCISRQRRWGVPIPIFYCKKCGEPLISKEAMAAVSELFRTEGSDQWYVKPAGEIVPAGIACQKCGHTHFDKEKDIMDVWFDSGVTHAAVLDKRSSLHWPADMYLEGADQYRGWFQSSLLTAVAWRGEAPYRTVVTHGWVVDGEGRKMSKSLSNGVAPNKIIEQYGADILRLWVASSDYHADIRISPEILKQLSDAYRKIRNTARFILGNLADFDPDFHSVSNNELQPIDRWALHRFDMVNQKVRTGYDAYEFHQVYHVIHNFCVVDMSNFYLDVIKDRLYVEKADSKGRRAAQTAMYIILDGMTRLISPILPYTSDEIWQAMKHDVSADPENIVLNQMPQLTGVDVDETFIQTWDCIHNIRDTVKKALELARNGKIIGASLDAKVQLFCDGDMYNFVKSVEKELPVVLIVSQVEVIKGGKGAFVSEEMEELTVTVLPAEGEKCARCWTYSDTVGSSAVHPEVCAHCASVLE